MYSAALKKPLTLFGPIPSMLLATFTFIVKRTWILHIPTCFLMLVFPPTIFLIDLADLHNSSQTDYFNPAIYTN